MQCSYFEDKNINMYGDLNVIDKRLSKVLNENPGETFNYIIGKTMPEIENETMLRALQELVTLPTVLETTGP